MYRRAAKYLSRLIVAVLLIACALGALRYAHAQASTWGSYFVFARDMNTLEQVKPSGTTENVVLDAPYRGATFSMVVLVDTGYLSAARKVNGSALFGFNRSVRAAAANALWRQQHNDPFVSAMAVRLRVLRTELELSDDDYVDLMTRAVQAIPYGTLHMSTFMPAVTVKTNSGVCADKSILLAALLAHEGFDAGIWVFPTQAHAAVALRGTGPGLRGSGYSLVETTRLTYVGEIDQSLRAAGPVCEIPQLIVFGNGTKRYTRDLETEFIADTLERTRGPRRIIPRAEIDAAVPERAEKGSVPSAQYAVSSRLAGWIDSRRDWPEATYAALAGTGPNR